MDGTDRAGINQINHYLYAEHIIELLSIDAHGLLIMLNST